MNPGGPIEEAGDTARTIVAALKSTPGILALVIFNLAFMGIVAWVQHSNGERWEKLMEMTLKQCTGVEKDK